MFCINHLAQLGRNAQDYIDHGVQPLAVGPSEAGAARISKMFKTPFPLLADPTGNVYALYGLGKETDSNSGAVVISQGGRLAYVHRAGNPQLSMRRKEIQAIVQELAPLRE